jgi:hypothetical protein
MAWLVKRPIFAKSLLCASNTQYSIMLFRANDPLLTTVDFSPMFLIYVFMKYTCRMATQRTMKTIPPGPPLVKGGHIIIYSPLWKRGMQGDFQMKTTG